MLQRPHGGIRFSRIIPNSNGIRNQLAGGRITPEDRVQLITDMEALHTFSGIINRTRRRDIGEFTHPQATDRGGCIDDRIRMSCMAHSLKRRRRYSAICVGNQSVNFMMTTLRRQLASCLHGLEPLLEDILKRRLDELEWSEADAVDAIPLLRNL